MLHWKLPLLKEQKQTIVIPLPWLWEGKGWHYLMDLYFFVENKLAGSNFDLHPELLISPVEEYGNASCHIEFKASFAQIYSPEN